MWRVNKVAVKKTKSEEFLDYIEKVTDEPTMDLPSVEAEFVEETNGNDGEWYSYTRHHLKEFEDGDVYEGKPLLLPVESVVFDEGAGR